MILLIWTKIILILFRIGEERMITIKKGMISDELKKFPIVLYGAGFAGRQCSKILKSHSVNVDIFVDDDRTKSGKCIEELTVYSYEQLVDYCRKKEHVNVILTSIYGVQIAKKVEKIPNVTIYEMYDWYTEIVMPERFGEMIYDEESIEKYKNNIEKLKKYLEDEESGLIFENLYQYMKTGDINYIYEVSSAEEQYFIKEVLEYFGERAFSIIDAGAYEGELIRAISELNLNVKEWYCFETNKENYEKLAEHAGENNFKGKQICVHKGLWNKNTSLHVFGSGTSSKVEEGEYQGNTVDMVTIDEYFKDTPIDLIKMDIEGAEMNALKGGMKVIKRDRPVLAVSIYHSLEDYYEILKLLLKELSNYKYYVRHHSMVFCETVLYAIPE